MNHKKMKFRLVFSLLSLTVVLGCSPEPEKDLSSQNTGSPSNPAKDDLPKAKTNPPQPKTETPEQKKFEQRSKERERAIAYIKRLGGEVSFSEARKTQIYMIGFSPALAEIERKHEEGGKVIGVNFSGSKTQDAALAKLTPFSQLERLVLSQTNVSGVDLAHLKTKKLVEFYSVKSPISDEGIRNLDGMESLEGITLGESSISDQGMSVFSSLKNLRGLSLWGNDIGDEGVAHLGNLTSLEGIDLAKTNVSDRGIQHLSGLINLKTLSLWSTQVTDEGVQSILKLKNLRNLNLASTKITDKGLLQLQELPNLSSLTIWGTGVSKEAIAKLKEKLPRLVIKK